MKNNIEKLREKIASSSGTDKIAALINLGFSLHSSSPIETERYAREALSLAEKAGLKSLIARSHKLLGISFAIRSVYDLALEHSFKALNIYHEIGNITSISDAYNNIALIYEDQNNFSLALDYHQRALEINLQKGTQESIAISYDNIGICYQSLGKIDEAHEFFDKSLKLFEEIDHTDGIAMTYNNMGSAFQAQENIDNALEFFHKALKIFEETDHKQFMTNTYLNIGAIEEKRLDYDQAEKYYTKALHTAKELGSRNQEIAVYKALSILCELLNRFQEALYFHKKHSELKEAIFNEKRSNQIAEMRTKYETEKKEKETELYRLKNVELVKAKEAAETAALVRARFLAVMSHEIRTPLNGIIGMTGLLLNSKLEGDQHDYIDTIRLCGETLITIINDILDFSKIESGKLSMEKHAFELKTCVEETFDLATIKLKDTNLDLIYHIDPDVPQFIYSDSTRLRQILLNLLDNAIKFTEKGEVYLTIKLRSKESKIAEIDFSIRDTGIGIAKSSLEHLFKPFTQIDSSTSRKFGGTGLGLAICKHLVELLGGRIRVKSSLNKGSTFNFTIKAAVAEGKDSDLSEEIVPAFQGKKVLILAENTTNAEVIASLCSLWGMVPETVTSPEIALDMVQNNGSFDVGLIDRYIHEKDGIEFCSKITDLCGSNQFPLIVMYASQTKIAEDSFNGLIHSYLTKPVRQSQLYEILMHVFAANDIGVKYSELKFSLQTDLGTKLPLRILLAEDNFINQKIVLRILKKMGYRADVAANGYEVLEALQAQSYDVIFMDINMPEMDGLEATERINLKWADLPSKPIIIAMTADTMQGDREKCLKAGMDDYMSKPISASELQNMVMQWGKELISLNKHEH